MTDKTPADTVIEQAARVIQDSWTDEDEYGAPEDMARALYDAGLLADPCHCDLNPATTDGPQEDCPQHGRRYAEWVEATDAKGAQVAELRATVEHITELAFEHNGCSGCQTPWWLRQALGSDFTNPWREDRP